MIYERNNTSFEEHAEVLNKMKEDKRGFWCFSMMVRSWKNSYPTIESGIWKPKKRKEYENSTRL